MNTASPSRLLLILLVASVCLNALFIGVGAAVAIRWQLHPQEQVLRMVMHHFARRLDHDDARIMRATMQEHHGQITAAWNDYRQSLKPLAAALQESPRNEDRLRTAKQEMRTRRIALGDAISDAVIASIEEISPEGRAALFKDGSAD